MSTARLLILVLAFLPFSGQARTLSDVNLAEELQINDESPILSLNGASLRRTYMIVNTYVGGLYLEHPSQSDEEIIRSDEHKRMLFHVLLNKVTARKVARSLKEALVVNINTEEQERLEPHINQFISMFEGKLHKNDEVNIDYIPGVGTKVTIAGEEKGTIPGKEFSDALLSVWLGKQPVSENFKNDILGVN